MPHDSKCILKYDPINDITAFVGDKSVEDLCCGKGALGRDGYIYALAEDSRVLKIDTVNNSHGFVGNSIQSEHSNLGWFDAILGIDGCIYWAPYNARRTMKYDPHSNQTSLVGDDFGRHMHRWYGGALATDGVVYCIPCRAKQVLAIDPLGEFSVETKTNVEEHPEAFGSLFHTIEAEENSVLSFTNFDHAVIKFGQSKVFEALEKSMKPINDFCRESNLCPFMIAAYYKESTVCAINNLLRRDLSWVNSWISSFERNTPKKKKNKIIYSNG